MILYKLYNFKLAVKHNKFSLKFKYDVNAYGLHFIYSD